MSVNDRAYWRWEDPCPGEALQGIIPYSVRATSLIARSQSPLLQQHFLQLSGAVSILSGLEYHSDNFLALLKQVKLRSSHAHSKLRHEVVAWVNRVGQLHYFTTSELVISKLGNVATPAIDAVLPFRHKHTAHRSFDMPRKNDSDHLKAVHAMSLSDFGGSVWSPRNGSPWPELDPTSPSSTHFLTFQIQETAGDAVILNIENAHPAVLHEVYSILDSLLA